MDDKFFGGNNEMNGGTADGDSNKDIPSEQNESTDVNTSSGSTTQNDDVFSENTAKEPYTMPNSTMYNQPETDSFSQNNESYYGYSKTDSNDGSYQNPNQSFNPNQPPNSNPYYNPNPNQYQYQYQNSNQNGYGLNYNNGPASDLKKKKLSTGAVVFIVLIAFTIIAATALLVSLFKSNSITPNTSNETATDSVHNEAPDDVDDLNVGSSSLEAGEAAKVAQIAQKYNVGILIYKNNSLYTEGSGVIAKEDNSGKYTYIITCAHVVNYSGVAISVLTEDGTEYQADVVGLDTRTDIAVVRIEDTGLNKAEFADSDELVVGQYVYAVGNPGGSEFFGSIANGIISAIDRPVSSSTGYEMECIQHTAAINPGNSGGALVNGEGKIIGINSMKIASTEYEGMGFAVPSNVVVGVFNSIIENGYVAGRAKLGISYTTPSLYSQTYAMYVQMKGLPTGTIVIAEIAADSELAAKDIKVGDMITKVNGKEMTDSGMLSEMIEGMSVGDSLKLTVVRVNTDNWSQTEQEITVKLVEDKGGTTVSQESENNSSGNQGGYDSNDLYEFFKNYYGF